MVRAGALWWRWIASTILLLAATPVVFGQERSTAAPAGDAADGRTAEQWLQMVQQAARRLDYSGTMVYQQGNEVYWFLPQNPLPQLLTQHFLHQRNTARCMKLWKPILIHPC